MEGKLSSTLLLHNVPGTLCDRVLLIGLGKEKDFRDREYRKAALAAVKALDGHGANDAASFIAELPVKKRDISWKIEQMVEVTMDATYRFAHPQCKKEDERRGVYTLVINVPQRNDLKKGDIAVKKGLAVAAGVRLAKNLGNLPGNICTPGYLAEQAQELAQSYVLKVEVLFVFFEKYKNKMDIQLLTGLSFTSKKGESWTFGDIVNAGSFGTIYQDGSNKDILIKTGKETVFFEKAVLIKIASDSIDHIPVMFDSGSLSSLGLKDTYFIAMPNYGESLHSMLLVSH